MGSKRRGRFWPAFWIFSFFLVWLLAVGVLSLTSEGNPGQKLFTAEGRKMVLETGAFFLWTAAFAVGGQKGRISERVSGAGILAGILAGTWLHQIFLPFLVSGLWLFSLLLLGDTIRRAAEGKFGKRQDEDDNGEMGIVWRLSAAFLLGSGSWISLICLLSAFGIGGLNRIRFLAAGTAGICILLNGKRLLKKGADLAKWLKGSRGETRERLETRERHEKTERDVLEGVLFSLILTMLFIQLARMNLKPDYDSLHYGLRSQYILDTGRGIYEDLGNINLVYTYPKGFEILSFPLAGTATWSYQLCFNLWLTVLVLVLAAGMGAISGGGRLRCLGIAAFCALTPGIMNMAITAKSDTATLVCQLCILGAAAGILAAGDRAAKGKYFFTGLGACLLSFSMKPTSLVFSSVLSVSCLVFLAVSAGKGRRKEGGFPKTDDRQKRGGWLPVSAAVLLTCGIGWLGTWIRTLRMTGVPTTSVFTSIWELMGFQVRWPYAFSAIPDQGLSMGPAESLGFLLRRLYGVLAAPVGEDMAHVVIAWGGSLTAVSLAAWLFWGRRKKEDHPVMSLIRMAGLWIGAVSLASIYLLWQVDGNYFMLLYVLLALIGAYSLEQGLHMARSGERMVSVILGTGCALFLAAVTLCTNWAGTSGFSPLCWKHRGFFDHQQAVYEKKCEEGNQAIWSILSADPENRVIAFGEHPEVLWFPCNVQSYYDVTGSGGNVRLVKTLDYFKDFLGFAGTDYIYVQAGWLEPGTRAYDVVRYMIEDGSLADVRYENGNMLAQVNLDGKLPTDPQAAAEEFYQVNGDAR